MTHSSLNSTTLGSMKFTSSQGLASCVGVRWRLYKCPDIKYGVFSVATVQVLTDGAVWGHWRRLNRVHVCLCVRFQRNLSAWVSSRTQTAVITKAFPKPAVFPVKPLFFWHWCHCESDSFWGQQDWALYTRMCLALWVKYEITFCLSSYYIWIWAHFATVKEYVL